MNIQTTSFQSLIDLQSEGIVLLGTGGDQQEWINGVTDILNKDLIAKGTPNELWDNAYSITSSGGRTDLILTFKKSKGKINLPKLSIWRLSFGGCSWLSDYIVNYRTHFGLPPIQNNENETENEDPYESNIRI